MGCVRFSAGRLNTACRSSAAPVEFTQRKASRREVELGGCKELGALLVSVAAAWQRLLDADGDNLEIEYRHTLEDLGRQQGTLGVIFGKGVSQLVRV